MIQDRHQRYLNQSSWTEPLRNYIISQNPVTPGSNVLEIGSGTGVIIQDFTEKYSTTSYGVDVDFKVNSFGKSVSPRVQYINGDGYILPFQDASFEVVLCHYFLLWAKDPIRMLQEAKRVIKPGGIFYALAEPDYSSRIDAPKSLIFLGELQNRSLVKQGVDLQTGRKLPELMHSAGFSDVNYGVSGYQKVAETIPDWFDSEWQIIEFDLAESMSHSELESYKNIDREAWSSGKRVLIIPTFYAYGKKPKNIINS